MKNNDEQLNDMRKRLGLLEVRKPREGSASALVALLHDDIQAARAANKSWKQIAADVSGSTVRNEDAVRIAFHRISKSKDRAATPPPLKKPRKAENTAVSAEQKVETSTDHGSEQGRTFHDLFRPMVDENFPGVAG